MISSDVVVDWYDGPLRGLARTAAGIIFHYQAIAWDMEYKTRLFALRVVDADTAEELEHALEASSARRPASPVVLLLLGETVLGRTHVLDRTKRAEESFQAADRSSRVDDLGSFIG